MVALDFFLRGGVTDACLADLAERFERVLVSHRARGGVVVLRFSAIFRPSFDRFCRNFFSQIEAVLTVRSIETMTTNNR